MASVEQATGTDDLAPWREALDGFERWLRRMQKWFSLTYLAGYLLLFVPFVLHSPWLLWFMLGGLIGLPLLGYAWRKLNRSNLSAEAVSVENHGDKRRLYEQLRYSNLAQRLASGELTGDEPCEFIPRMYHWLLPPLQKSDRLPLLRRTMMWLQWYLGPPRNELSKYWTMVFAFSFMPLIGIGFGLDGHALSSTLFIAGAWLMFLGLSASIYDSEARQFVSYLHEAWDSTADAPVLIASAGNASARQLSLNLAQEALERARGDSQVLSVLSWIACFMLFIVARSGEPGTFPHALWGLAFLPLLVVSEAIARSDSPFVSPYRRQLRAHLEHSALAARLATGECGYTRLIQYTHPWLRWCLRFPSPPKALTENYAVQVWFTALNLDWFLSAPRRLLRWEWLTMLGAIIILAGRSAQLMYLNYVLLPLEPAPGLSVFELAWWVLASMLVLAPALCDTRRNIWSEELIAYLRRHTD